MDSFRNASKNTMFEQWLDATQRPAATAQGQTVAVAAAGKANEPPIKEPARMLELVEYLAEDTSGKVDPQTAAKAR